MAMRSLGKVTTNAGTPVRLTANEADTTARYVVHSFLVEVLQGNTTKIYVGASNLNRTTLAGVYAVIPVPTLTAGVATILPSFSATVTYASGAFNLAEVWMDVDSNGEGALVSAIKA